MKTPQWLLSAAVLLLFLNLAIIIWQRATSVKEPKQNTYAAETSAAVSEAQDFKTPEVVDYPAAEISLPEDKGSVKAPDIIMPPSLVKPAKPLAHRKPTKPNMKSSIKFMMDVCSNQPEVCNKKFFQSFEKIVEQCKNTPGRANPADCERLENFVSEGRGKF